MSASTAVCTENVVRPRAASVAAMVLPAGVAPDSPLGLSFLRRLRRFEYIDGSLEQ